MTGTTRRLALLAEGRFTPFDAKTAVGLLRYRPGEVAAVIDGTRAGGTAQSCVGVGGAIPVVATLDEVAARGANGLLVGVAPQGGALPESWRAMVLGALARGWDVWSGLHEFLTEDAAFAAAARQGGGRLHDVRRPPPGRPIAARRAAAVAARVVLTVGSDCNVGKMTAALEIVDALRGLGLNACFVATGQTGILIEGDGVAVDAVVADFVAGFAEDLVLRAAADADVVVVEGQGALLHPGYSGVTLGLLHGACPSALVLCHHAGRESVRVPGRAPDPADPVIPPLPDLVRLYEEAAAWVWPAATCGVALNTLGLDDDAARRAVGAAAAATGLPATDPVRFGAAPLARAIAALPSARRTHAPHA